MDGKVISTRDVIFDEETVFDGKKSHPNNQLIAHMDELVARISLESPQVKNEEILEVDEELLSLESTWESGDSNVEQNLPVSEEDEDIEIVPAVEEGLVTPPPSEVESKDSPISLFKVMWKTCRITRTR
jgi:inorganic triphosphatase YgiF